LNTLTGGGSSGGSGGDDKQAASPKALSRMTKKDLQAECDERGVDRMGKVAELRVRLRAARKAEAEAVKANAKKNRK